MTTMPSVPVILQQRNQRRKHAARSPLFRLALVSSGVLSLLLALAALGGALFFASLARDLPPVSRLPALLDAPRGELLQPTRLYDRSGEHLLLSLENPASAGRIYRFLPASAPAGALLLPSNIITATLAAADPGFWNHAGYTVAGVLEGSHTTLAQRLAVDYLLQDEAPALRRNLRERLLALRITESFGRDKALEWYLNSADYGHLAFGVDAAARLYLGKSVDELSLAEAALLAATALEPASNPFDAPEAALERQKTIIQRMLAQRFISPEQGIQAMREVLVIRQPPQSDLDLSVAPAFTRLALRQLETQLSRQRLARGGLVVRTTLDYSLQLQVECAAAAQLARLGQTPSQSALPVCPAADLLPTLPTNPAPLPGGLQVDALVLDPASGQILALNGALPAGPDAAPLIARPPGSMATTFVYLTAFARGLGPATLLWDTPPETVGPTVSNFDGRWHGPMRLRLAMANDYLAPAGQVATQVGLENIWRTAQQLGLSYADTPVSVENPFGFRDINLLETARVFSVLANQGLLTGRLIQGEDTASGLLAEQNGPLPLLQPTAILSIQDGSARTILDWSLPQSRPLITQQLAYLMTAVMSDEATRWPTLGLSNPLQVDRPAAVRTARTYSGNSYWVLGYTPQRTVGVWLGASSTTFTVEPTSVAVLQSAAAGLWSALTRSASQNLPVRVFETPAGISRLKVCDPSGLLPTKDCPNLVEEVFLAGSEPIQADNLFQSMAINRETGRLATVFTSPELVTEQVYFIPPPEHSDWLQTSGASLPPSDYDILPGSLQERRHAHLTSPAMFAALSGRVVISGRADGEAFDFYRIQVGQGLNPQEWFLVQEDVYQPVTDGKLGTWDTSGLNGLYAVQLVVVQKDQSVERATALVTVDNQPPQVAITSPVPGAEISLAQRPNPVLRASVQDDLGLQKVEFLIDGQRLAVMLSAPYAISWKAAPGAHILLVKATDLAGNTSQVEVSFTVVR